MMSNGPASTNPFDVKVAEHTSIEDPKAPTTNPFNVDVQEPTSMEEKKPIAASKTNPFASELPEKKIEEENKPFLTSSAPNSANEKSAQSSTSNEKPAPLGPMWTGRFKIVKQTAFNLILKLPFRADITVLFLMFVDLIAVVVLLVYDNVNGSVSMTELFFYVISLVATVFGVLYLCGTKPPRDMTRLFVRNKDLLTEYDRLGIEHTEALARQKEEVEAQKMGNVRLSWTVVKFKKENEGLKEQNQDLKSVTEYLAKNSVKQLEEIEDQIKEFKNSNEKLAEEIKDVNTNIDVMENVTRQNRENYKLQRAQLEIMKDQNVRGEQLTEKGKETARHLNEVIRVADLNEELAEMPDVPVHEPMTDVAEEKNLEIKTKPQVDMENV